MISRIKALLLRLFQRREQHEYAKRWKALTPRQKQAVIICHRAARRMQEMKSEAQALIAELEPIADTLEHPQQSREVAETLARRFEELYAAIEEIGREHSREQDFLQYADRYMLDLGVLD